MKIPKVIQPVFEIEYKNIQGFICAIYAIIRVGIKKAHIDCCINPCSYKGTVKRHYFYIIPKYKFIKVKEWSEQD